MTSAAAVTNGDDALKIAYETLRTHVLTTATARSATGLVVLLRQGMAAWMAQCRSFIVCPASPPRPVPKATPVFADEIHASLVQVFASMVLADPQETCV